jgi:hypothetical protein
MVLPDTDTPQTLLHNVCSRNSVVEIIVRVSSAVSSIISAQVEAHVLPIKTLAVTLDSIINVHVRSEVRTVPQGLSNGFKILLEIFADRIRGGGPQIILYAIVRLREGPLHFNLNHVVGADLSFNLVSIRFEHEKGGDRYVSSRTIVCHDGLRWLAIKFSTS